MMAIVDHAADRELQTCSYLLKEELNVPIVRYACTTAGKQKVI